MLSNAILILFHFLQHKLNSVHLHFIWWLQNFQRGVTQNLCKKLKLSTWIFSMRVGRHVFCYFGPFNLRDWSVSVWANHVNVCTVFPDVSSSLLERCIEGSFVWMSALNLTRFEIFRNVYTTILLNNLNTVLFIFLQTITVIYSIGRQWQLFEWRDLCIQDRGERSSGQGRRPSNPRQNNRGMWCNTQCSVFMWRKKDVL